MVPASIRSRLSFLALSERFVRLVWGAARLLAIVGLVLILAGLVDWIYDRYDDTPLILRLGLTALQLLVAAGLVVVFVVLPLCFTLSYADLAGLVEKAFPALRGRVRSAVELNAPGARTAGMSQPLIDEVTRQAESQLGELPVSQAIDWSRLGWAAGVVIPVGLILALFLLLAPGTTFALLQRMCLMDVEIPRSVQLTGAGRTTWPTGEEIQVQFRATGSGAASSGPGTIIITGEGLPRERFTLEQVKTDDDGTLYQATIPSPGSTFQAWAWVGDGRTRQPREITLEPRPDLVASAAWLILPEFVGTRPNQQPYQELQDRGDIVGFRGCSARIEMKANKPLLSATLSILGPDDDGPGEHEVRSIAMKSADDESLDWSATFDLRPNETAYSIQMLDRNKDKNRKPPRRAITLLPDEPPQVLLLPERFPGEGQVSFLEDSEVDGLPVLFGKAIRVGYRSRTNLSLTKGVLRYRILKPGTEGKTESIPWLSLPLGEVLPTAEAGAYDLALGVWENNKTSETEFTAIPSYNPEMARGRKEAGGRFDFKTANLPELKVGDRIEYYVEIHDSRPGSKAGSSEVRVKEIVNFEGLDSWIRVKLDEAKKLQQLESRQSGLFGPTSPGSP